MNDGTGFGAAKLTSHASEDKASTIVCIVCGILALLAIIALVLVPVIVAVIKLWGVTEIVTCEFDYFWVFRFLFLEDFLEDFFGFLSKDSLKDFSEDFLNFFDFSLVDFYHQNNY